MINHFELQHRLARLNPYHSVVRVLDPDPDCILTGIKNTAAIPNSLMHRLENHGFGLHTIDKKSQLAGRAVDTQLINPISGRLMSGSSSGTAINVFSAINDFGIGTDGGGSVLAPAISVNIMGFISKLIKAESMEKEARPNTDGIIATASLGFMARDRSILLKAIESTMGLKPAESSGKIFADRTYGDLDCEVIPLMDALAPRSQLAPYLQATLRKCDVLMVTEGPIDLDGFGDSLFGHFDERTRRIQKMANKGYVRVCNIAGATALAIPQEGLGMATLLMCESKEEKIACLLKAAEEIPDVHDELIERYFLDLNNYFLDGYQI